jgi:hypothetical protein
MKNQLNGNPTYDNAYLNGQKKNDRNYKIMNERIWGFGSSRRMVVKQIILYISTCTIRYPGKTQKN